MARSSSDPPLIVGWGELLWDRLPSGRRLGGAPANVAFHASCLGDRGVPVSRVGDDVLGQAAIEQLAAAGVETRFIQRDTDHSTGWVDVELVAGEPIYTIAADVAWDQLAVDAAVEQLLAEAAVFVFGTLAQRSLSGTAALRRALSALPRDCVRLCDLNLRPPFDSAEAIELSIDAATAVKVSSSEVELLQQRTGITDLPRRWCEARGVELVAITRGAGGSCLVTSHGEADHPGVPSAGGGDPIGAGDAFTAVLAHHLVRRSAPDVINAAANGYASFVAGSLGAMPRPPAAVLGAARAVTAS